MTSEEAQEIDAILTRLDTAIAARTMAETDRAKQLLVELQEENARLRREIVRLTRQLRPFFDAGRRHD